MNRAFPGNPNGSPTEMLANYLESDLIHGFDAIIDLHSEGKASFFMPCSFAQKSKNNNLFKQNLNLVKSFGIRTIWVLGENNDNRSLNSAADRAAIPMIAAKLGSGGGVKPEITNLAEMGISNILNDLNIYKSAKKVKS
jgi:predicted deacylase